MTMSYLSELLSETSNSSASLVSFHLHKFAQNDPLLYVVFLEVFTNINALIPRRNLDTQRR